MKKIIIFFLLCSSNVSFGMPWLTGEPASPKESPKAEPKLDEDNVSFGMFASLVSLVTGEPALPKESPELDPELDEDDKEIDLEYEMAKYLPQEDDPDGKSKHYLVATAEAALQIKKQKDNEE